jgi:hypothetical protein
LSLCFCLLCSICLDLQTLSLPLNLLIPLLQMFW